jgi:DNA repair protein RadC
MSDKQKKSDKKINLHEGHRERVRDKFLETGNLDNFKDHEILEFLLFYAYLQKDTNEIAHSMINTFGSFSNALEAAPHEIMRRCNVTERVAVLVSLMPHIAKAFLLGKYEKKEVMDNSRPVGEYCTKLFIDSKYEAFYMICLDTTRRLLCTELIQKGDLDSAVIYPRLVVEAAIRNHAAAVVLTHNHPGGTLMPSKSDMQVTKRLKAALETVGIELIDHIIVADGKYYSFVEKRMNF